MCRTQHSWWRKLVRFNLWATLYSSWFLGLFPFIYVRRTRRLRRSRWLVGYGIILNFAVAVVAFLNMAATETADKQRIFVRNPLAYQIDQLHNCILLITLSVTYFRNWWVSAELERILNVLLDLHYRHFSKFDSLECREFNNYVIYKGSCILLELISLVVMEFVHPPEFTAGMIVGVFCFMSMQLGVLLVSMHFHLAVIYIYRAIWIINQEFLRLLNQLCVNRSTKSKRVQKLHYLYSRLLELNQRLVAIYDYQITLILASLLGINIISPFYIIIYAVSLKNPVTIVIALNFLQTLLINFFDIWLNFSVCELAVRANLGTLRILKLFNDLPDLSTDLERSIADFAIYSSHQRLKFNHFGMFDVNNAVGFRLIITGATYLVYLVQFDFMNL